MKKRGNAGEQTANYCKRESYDLDICEDYLDILSKYDELPEKDQKHIKQEIDELHRATGKIPFD